MNTAEKIKRDMRRNETEVLRHLRTHRVSNIFGFGLSWMKALERLMKASKVLYSAKSGCYVARPRVRAVTGGAR